MPNEKETDSVAITLENLKTVEASVHLGVVIGHALEAAAKVPGIPRVTLFLDHQGAVRIASPTMVHVLPGAFDIPPSAPYKFIAKLSEFPAPKWVTLHNGELWGIEYQGDQHGDQEAE